MSGLNDQSTAGDTYSAIATKHRGLLTPQERQIVALKKAADQADYECAKLADAIKALQDKAEAALQRAKVARDAFTQALAAGGTQ